MELGAKTLQPGVFTSLFSSLFGAAMVLFVALTVQGAQADSVSDFYRGRNVSLIVSTGAGTGYDLIARTLAKHLPRHVPGAPSIIVQNMPGASGLAAANYVYNAAPKDGTVVAGFQGIIPFEPLLGTKEANFDASKFNWLGSLSEETGILIARAGVSAKSIEDLKSHEITIGTSSPASQDAVFARLFNQVLGTKFKVVLGYPAQNDVFLAMDRGEVDARFVYYSSLASTRPDWIPKQHVKLLLQYGPAKAPAIGDVPFAEDLVTNRDDKLLMKAAFAPLTLGRSYLMPPGVPAERVAAMRGALMSILKDEAFVRDIQTQMLSLDWPQSGDQVENFITSVCSISPSILDQFRKLVHP
jgi:tripartite-type tricarboxylate transporter receptor subunit TctC